MAAQKSELLVPLKEYLSAGIQVGTKSRTKDMEDFIYKVHQNKLAILNVEKINERLAVAAKLVSQYNSEDILIVCRRENGWLAVKKFAETIPGVKYFIGRYPAGVTTNPNLDNYIEPKLIIVTDPWPDKNAINDAAIVGIPVIAMCDSNNDFKSVDLVIPCNNRGNKALGLVYWILANEYAKAKGYIAKNKTIKASIDSFYE
ncbi:MAG: 30S ribosomal protein S2 [Candidatus Woesearchaeota archaeon]|nr:MAG: 30S ribosomal protein S2 [Candidatus Woesearchaeota archaeon]